MSEFWGLLACGGLGWALLVFVGYRCHRAELANDAPRCERCRSECDGRFCDYCEVADELQIGRWSVASPEELTEIAAVIAKRYGPTLADSKIGIAVLTFDLEDAGGTIAYCSSANREDMRRALRGLLEKWDREAPS